MSEGTAAGIPPPSRDLSNKAAIVGIGETDYHADYVAARSKAPDYQPPSLEQLATTAFERALNDAGLARGDIDGLSVSLTYGGPDAEAMAEVLGIVPRLGIVNGGIMAGPLPVVCGHIAAGRCDTVAMIYAVTTRAMGRQFGGSTYTGAGSFSYYYYHPWGWSSQAAHWALMFRHYQSTYGATEEDLGAVAVQVREHAIVNPNSVMQKQMSIEDYLASRYIVRPLRLFDMCLVNDGAVCLIVRRADLARDMPHAPVLVSGWGEAKVGGSKLRELVCEGLRPQLQSAGDQALSMADAALSDIGHLESYDASTIHLIRQMEGYGFVEAGQGLSFCKDGQMAVNGRLPVNTGGGSLSNSYMHGWNQVAEVVRQLRHEAGPRQVDGIARSMFSLAQTDQAHPIVFTRGSRS
jgi:acetyl-CoA acetyltransferase